MKKQKFNIILTKEFLIKEFITNKKLKNKILLFNDTKINI